MLQCGALSCSKLTLLLLIADDGSVYTMGLNDAGQLGHSHGSDSVSVSSDTVGHKQDGFPRKPMTFPQCRFGINSTLSKRLDLPQHCTQPSLSICITG